MQEPIRLECNFVIYTLAMIRIFRLELSVFSIVAYAAALFGPSARSRRTVLLCPRSFMLAELSPPALGRREAFADAQTVQEKRVGVTPPA